MRRDAAAVRPPQPPRASALNGSGHRSTPQRRAVRRYLASVDHHPTAEEVYLAVKQEVPRVSLATVYSALELLVRSGLGSKLSYGDAAARYDIRTDVHAHSRCLGCGRVRDLEVVPDAGWLRRLRAPGFEATGFRFELVGRCVDCRAKTAAPRNLRRRR